MRLLIVAVSIFLLSSQSTAQSASQQISLGDRAYSTLDASAALAHYEAAISEDPQNYPALWKSSRSLMDLSSTERDKNRRDSLYAAAEKYARRAIAVSPNHPEGHFSLARALGKTALAQSPRGRIKYAKDVRNEALKCLALDPKHAGCLHVMGMWNAEVMRLNGFVRTMAKAFLGGQVFGTASWQQAIDYMERSVTQEPNRIAHRADLAEIYLERGQKEKAKAEFEAIVSLPATDLGDAGSKAYAREFLKKL